MTDIMPVELLPLNDTTKITPIIAMVYKEIFLPIGIQSTQMHINEWNEESFKKFEVFVEKNKQKIVDLDYIIDIARNSRLQNLTNYFVEKSLKTLRYLRKYS